MFCLRRLASFANTSFGFQAATEPSIPVSCQLRLELAAEQIQGLCRSHVMPCTMCLARGGGCADIRCAVCSVALACWQLWKVDINNAACRAQPCTLATLAYHGTQAPLKGQVGSPVSLLPRGAWLHIPGVHVCPTC